MADVRVTYDQEANAAYVYLADPRPPPDLAHEDKLGRLTTTRVPADCGPTATPAIRQTCPSSQSASKHSRLARTPRDDIVTTGSEGRGMHTKPTASSTPPAAIATNPCRAQVLDWHRGLLADGTMATIEGVEVDRDAVPSPSAVPPSRGSPAGTSTAVWAIA
jgi:hypothetical protein